MIFTNVSFIIEPSVEVREVCCPDIIPAFLFTILFKAINLVIPFEISTPDSLVIVFAFTIRFSSVIILPELTRSSTVRLILPSAIIVAPDTFT